MDGSGFEDTIRMNGNGHYDLHAHTTTSDGKLTPTELVRLAAEQGLKAIAVTDHDTVDGIAEARAEAPAGLEVVPGVEVSASFGSVPVHVLGLFIDHEQPELVQFFREAGERRVSRVHEMLEKLSKLGVTIDAESVFARSTHGTVGRPHVAEELVAQGVVADLPEAFERYLADDGPAFVGYEKVSFEDAIALIESAGGLASLAHPFVLENDALIEDMVASGLPALEVYHSDHTPEKTADYERISDELNLLRTGGSDFHRAPNGAPARLGCPELTEEAFETLRTARSRNAP